MNRQASVIFIAEILESTLIKYYENKILNCNNVFNNLNDDNRM